MAWLGSKPPLSLELRSILDLDDNQYRCYEIHSTAKSTVMISVCCLIYGDLGQYLLTLSVVFDPHARGSQMKVRLRQAGLRPPIRIELRCRIGNVRKDSLLPLATPAMTLKTTFRLLTME